MTQRSPVLQGTIGSRDRKELTVIGDAVNTTARLEGMTQEAAFPIVVSGALVEVLPPGWWPACVPLGKLKPRGEQREVEILGGQEPATVDAEEGAPAGRALA